MSKKERIWKKHYWQSMNECEIRVYDKEKKILTSKKNELKMNERNDTVRKSKKKGNRSLWRTEASGKKPL